MFTKNKKILSDVSQPKYSQNKEALLSNIKLIKSIHSKIKDVRNINKINSMMEMFHIYLNESLVSKDIFQKREIWLANYSQAVVENLYKYYYEKYIKFTKNKKISNEKLNELLMDIIEKTGNYYLINELPINGVILDMIGSMSIMFCFVNEHDDSARYHAILSSVYELIKYLDISNNCECDVSDDINHEFVLGNYFKSIFRNLYLHQIDLYKELNGI